MEHAQSIIEIILLALIIGGVIAFALWLRQPPPPTPLPGEPPLDLVHEPQIMKFSEIVPFVANDLRIEAQLPEWRERMLRVGDVLRYQRVGAIIFLHGTFAGYDPFDLLPGLQEIMPRLHRRLEGPIQRLSRRFIDRLAQDNGNFLASYVETFAEATACSAHCQLFHWSSANHHIGRLTGALELIDALLKLPSLPDGSRVLLLGHSHARQVFALFTHLLSESELGLSLWKFVEERKLCPDSTRALCPRLQTLRFDFVTLGGPVRYPWAFLPEMRALHLINHRGGGLSFEKPFSFWRTAGGDYVQQWGSGGSDSIASSARDRRYNRILDPLLGKGLDTRVWLQNLARRQRIGNFGRTLLIDYEDMAALMPNFLSTLFGHGVYTRFRAMLFHAELVCRYLYNESIPVENESEKK